MSYYIYKDKDDTLRCNWCHAQLKRNKHGKMPKICPICQTNLKSINSSRFAKILGETANCPKCFHFPTLLTATDYSYSDNAYSQHRLSCLNCGKVKTNLHYSVEGVVSEWNALANKQTSTENEGA